MFKIKKTYRDICFIVIIKITKRVKYNGAIILCCICIQIRVFNNNTLDYRLI